MLHSSSSDTVVWCGNPKPLFLYRCCPSRLPPSTKDIWFSLSTHPCARGQTPRKKRTNTFLLIMCGTHRRSERGTHSVGKGPDSEPTTNVVVHLHLPFFLAVSNAAEERLLRSSTGGKTIPLGFALPVSSQQRQKQRKKIKGVKKSLFSEWDVSGLIRVRIKAHLLDYLNIHF